MLLKIRRSPDSSQAESVAMDFQNDSYSFVSDIFKQLRLLEGFSCSKRGSTVGHQVTAFVTKAFNP